MGAAAGRAREPKSGGGRRAAVPGGWTPAPPAAAEHSASNLLTGPEQRAANPAGGRGRAGGRRDPAPLPRGRRVYCALITRRRAGAGPWARTRCAPSPWTAPRRAPPQSPGGRAQRLIANPLGSGSHGLGHLPPHGCSRALQLARRRLASSPRPPPAKLPGQRGGGCFGERGRSRLSRRDHKESLLPASAWHQIGRAHV